MRLIDADRLIEAIKEYIYCQSSPDDDILDKIYFKGMKYSLRIIEKQEPVKQVKRGHWLVCQEVDRQLKCSQCGCHTFWMEKVVPNYCPHCGARMIEVKE